MKTGGHPGSPPEREVQFRRPRDLLFLSMKQALKQDQCRGADHFIKFSHYFWKWSRSADSPLDRCVRLVSGCF